MRSPIRICSSHPTTKEAHGVPIFVDKGDIKGARARYDFIEGSKYLMEIEEILLPVYEVN